MSKLYSVGQMNLLSDALETAGFSSEDVDKMLSFRYLHKFKDVLRGRARIFLPETHTIDCNVNPRPPLGWSISRHIRLGEIEWNPQSVELFQVEGQKNVEGSGSVAIEAELLLLLRAANKRPLNACVSDYLLEYPELIPESWKGKTIHFWGTIFRNRDNEDCLYYMECMDGKWCLGYRHLVGGRWRSCDYAALLVS